MGTTLTGTTPQDTYDSLIKVTDNGPLGPTTAKYLSDGLGNDSPLALSQAAVGIGTNAPAAKLDVSSTDSLIATFTSNAAASALSINNTSANLWGSNIEFKTNNAGKGYVGTIGSLIGNTDQDLVMYATAGLGVRLYTNGNNERLRVTSAGNVGIGTSSPSVKTEISGSASGDFAALALTNTNQAGTADAATLSFKLGRSVDSFLFTVPAIKFVKEQQWTSSGPTIDGALAFSTIANESTTEKMRITSTGNVGIGTTNPNTFNTSGAKLVVAGGGVQALFSDATYYTLGIKHSGVGSEAVGMFGGTLGSAVALMTNNTERMRIDASGNVGIGTSAPAAKLQTTGSDAASIITGVALENFIATNPSSGNGVAVDFRLNNSGNTSVVTGKISTVNTFFRSNTDMVFSTFTSDALTEKARILSSGGITFNGDTSANNALNDYETGAWSPQVYYQNATDQANATDVTQVGSYTKIGRLVTITCVLQWTITGSPAADNIGVKNLPFASTTGTDLIWFGSCQMVNAGSYPTDGYKIYMNQNSSLVLLYDDRTDSGNYGASVGASGTKTLRFSFTYSAS